jgi:precorrin-6B methylase 2
MALSGGIGADVSGAATHKAFTAYDIQACLYDAERVDYLRAAIRQAVRPGDVVVDAGSGTGLLGMFAAQAGARRVYCLELNEEFIPVIEHNARRNGMADKIVAIHADATSCELPEMVDVVVSEVISAGFFYEPQLQIVSNLRRFLKPGGQVVPASMNNYVELIEAQDQLYGLTFNYDSRFTELDGDRGLTTREPYLATDFRTTESDPKIDKTVRITAQADGLATAVKITYDIEFVPGVLADKPTEFLLNPQIIFLRDPRELRAGQSYDVSLRYLASDAPLTCDIEVA